jgi:hypothetical protein
MPLILVTWEVEIRRIAVQGQPMRKKKARPYLKNNHRKKDHNHGSSLPPEKKKGRDYFFIQLSRHMSCSWRQ